MKSVYKYLSYQTETKYGQTDVRTTDTQTDERTDRHTEGQRENIIPRHLRRAGYKNSVLQPKKYGNKLVEFTKTL